MSAGSRGAPADPACPTLILGRSCAPGSVGVCVEDGFFCQFNKQFRKYLCCSLYRTVGDSLLFGRAHISLLL